MGMIDAELLNIQQGTWSVTTFSTHIIKIDNSSIIILKHNFKKLNCSCVHQGTHIHCNTNEK